MAMTEAAMAALIKANLDAILPGAAAQCDIAYLEAFCKGIIDHITSAGVVTGVASGVLAGGATAPTTGTIS